MREPNRDDTKYKFLKENIRVEISQAKLKETATLWHSKSNNYDFKISSKMAGTNR